MSEALKSMPLMDHLKALRKVLAVGFGVLIVGTLLCWVFSERILAVITELLPNEEPAHIFSPPEAFLIRLKVSAFTALFFGLPFILYQVWAFIAPGLFRPEKRRILPVFLSSAFLFYLGTYFAYTVIIPIMMNYFFGLSPEGAEMTVGISQLFSVVARLSLAFGIVFQLPILILVLSALGVVSPGWLLSQWRIALLLMLLFSSLLTPPDLISQIAMTLPLFLLYLISALIAILARGKRGRVDSAEDP